MAPKKKTSSKSTNIKKAPYDVQTKSEQPKNSNESALITSVMNRLSQQFNLVIVLVIALFIFQAYTFYRVKTIESNGVVVGAGTPQESPLSDEKLLSYAKDLKLNEKDFQKCFESEEGKALVSADSAQAADFGVQGTPGFFINGRFLGGAFPFESFKEIIDKELDGTGSANCTDYSEDLQQYCKDGENAPFKPAPVEVALGDAPIQGPKDAKVTIVEFSDFECPFCQRAFGTVQQIQKAYPKEVRIVYKQLPLTNLHPHAQKAAEASVCAQKQGKFWEYHDTLFKAQGA